MPYMPLNCGEQRVTSDGKIITTLPVTREMFTNSPSSDQTKKRVSAYARVSTDNEEQLTSYEAQVDYYTKYIKSNPAWTYCGLYTDEGISGTNTTKREGFKQMVADALDGKFDMIITKSVSRFARNTVDSLTAIRQLKEKGVRIYFEKENIDTFDSKGELMITLMSSLAQEESRSISQNTTWGQRKRFSDGKLIMPFSHFLGYDRGEDGKPVINEKEAKVVRLIYKLYLDGKSTSAIARCLMQQGVPTPAGCATWQTTTIDSILTNEKYRGDAILQKKFTVDFLTKKMKKNEGEVQQYYVHNSHPAIVSQEVFDLAQVERHRRQEGHIRICSGSVFAGKIYCGECGGLYGSKVWNSTNKYRRVVWQCNNKYGRCGRKGNKGLEHQESLNDVRSEDNNEGAVMNTTKADVSKTEIGPRCSTPHVTETTLKAAFVRLINDMLAERDEVMAFYQATINNLTDASPLQADKKVLEQEVAAIKVSMREWIAENARRAMPSEQYQARYDELNDQLIDASAKTAAIDEKILLQSARRGNAMKVMEVLRRGENAGSGESGGGAGSGEGAVSGGQVESFDEDMFGGLVDRVIVETGRLVFKLKDGSEREVII